MKLAWKMFHANNTFGLYHRFVKQIAHITIRQSKLLNDGSIPDRTFKKVQWYMVEAVVMGEMLAHLADHSITKRDKESLIYLGAIMALFDVIVDELRLDKDRVNRILENTFSPVKRRDSFNETAIEKVFYLYLDKVTGTIEEEYWSEISGHLNIIKLQTESDVQYKNGLSDERVIEITLGKGGVSALICSAFIQQKSYLFKDSVFHIGGFIQMMNDCQDIHKDTVAGIKTFVHYCKNFYDIFIRLDEQRVKTFRLIKTMDYPREALYKTLFDLNAMFIVISYKLHKYSDICDQHLDFNAIARMDKQKFRVNPFSLQTIIACSKKIIQFDYNNNESTADFKFEKSNN